MSVPVYIAAGLGVLLLGATSAHRAKAKPKAHRQVPRHAQHHKSSVTLKHAPGSRAEAYALLSPDACLTELGRRHIPFTREAFKRGVKIPVRLTGKVGGVLYRTDFPDNERSDVPWEVYDCRLVLSVSDFSEILREHAIAEVRIFSAWRPPSKNWPMDQWGRRHQGALAIDVRELRKDTGEVLNVLEHFNGKLGAPQCTQAANPPSPATPEARELHDLVCAAAESHVFNSVLTPNYDPAHRNHFHLELTPDVDWFMLR